MNERITECIQREKTFFYFKSNQGMKRPYLELNVTNYTAEQVMDTIVKTDTKPTLYIVITLSGINLRVDIQPLVWTYKLTSWCFQGPTVIKTSRNTKGICQ